MRRKSASPRTKSPRIARRSAGRVSYSATFVKRERWWVAWTDDIPGALTQGRTLAEAKENLRDAIRVMLAPVTAEAVAGGTVVVRERIRI